MPYIYTMKTPNLVEIYNKDPQFFAQLGGHGLINLDQIAGDVNERGNNALQEAVSQGDVMTFDALTALLKGGDARLREQIINHQNADGDTAVHIALKQSAGTRDSVQPFQYFVKTLHRMGGRLDIANRRGEVVTYEPDTELESPQSSIGSDSIRNIVNGYSSKSPLPDTLSTVTNSEPYIAPASPRQLQASPAFNSPAFLDLVSSDADAGESVFIRQAGGWTGAHGADALTTELDGPASLSEISSTNLSTIREDGAFGSDSDSLFIQAGGDYSRDAIRGSRRLFVNQLSETTMMSEGGAKVKESTQLHDESIQVIQEHGYSHEDARVIKAILWSIVKDKYPELSNLEKSRKLREKADDKSLIESIDLEKSRAKIEKSKAEKAKAKAEPEKKASKKATTKKASTKKASKKASRTKKH
jgi:hypothetical protein